MKNVMGVINLGNEQEILKELTQQRCLASVPFGSKYRLIDFALSNMVNSGVKNIGIFALEKYRSLLDHIGTGEEWDLDRKRGGLFILPPAMFSEGGYKGDIQNFGANIDYLDKSPQEYVIISGSIMVCNMTYSEALAFHIKEGADITLIYKQDYLWENSSLYNLQLTKYGRVTVMNEQSNNGNTAGNMWMNIAIMKKALFIDLIKECIESKTYSFMLDAIMRNVNRLKIYGYPFKGYLAVINTLSNYYNSSLELLKPEVYKELFMKEEQIFTKTKNEPPTQYTEKSEVKNSLLANGCVIEGILHKSVLFNGVQIEQGAIIRNSIIMPGCKIGKYAELENCILDKEVQISEREIIKGDKYSVFGKRSVV